jgi:hypothetical protein
MTQITHWTQNHTGFRTIRKMGRWDIFLVPAWNRTTNSRLSKLQPNYQYDKVIIASAFTQQEGSVPYRWRITCTYFRSVDKKWTQHDLKWASFQMHLPFSVNTKSRYGSNHGTEQMWKYGSCDIGDRNWCLCKPNWSLLKRFDKVRNGGKYLHTTFTAFCFCQQLMTSFDLSIQQHSDALEKVRKSGYVMLTL